MKLTHRLALPFALALVALASIGPVTEAAQDGKTTLTGKYVWTSENYSENLKATFTPTGENTFDVRFDFKFDGRQRVYKGTAEGSLDGDLEGTVLNENQRRTFTFAGSFDDDGVFHGTHAEVRRDREQSTGTLTLRR